MAANYKFRVTSPVNYLRKFMVKILLPSPTLYIMIMKSVPISLVLFHGNKSAFEPRPVLRAVEWGATGLSTTCECIHQKHIYGCILDKYI
jgi:hypothetical protein